MNGIVITVIGGIILIIAFVFIRLYSNKKSEYIEIKEKYDSLYNKYKDVIDLDSYKENVSSDIKKMKSDLSELQSSYSERHDYFEKLLKTISLYEEKEDIIEYGLYKPHFDFDTSEKYKTALLNVRETEKLLIKKERAAVCYNNWTVNGSISEGEKQTKRYIKLMLRAFNGECDAMIADVRWNNIAKMEERLEKSFETINKLGETHTISITNEYKELKLKELGLTYGYQELLHLEKEEQRMIREQMREEEKVQKEIEQKQKEIEEQQKEEERLQKKMQEAIGQAKQEEAEKYKKMIADLQQQIENGKRAISQAQQTKAGYVYIISNIGSFGENVYKIGMTRRLEPKERIDELGSASVPFEFDIHAMIKSDNAPELESSLHKFFSAKRVNLVNPRKEFFFVTLEEIEKYAKENNINVEFTKVAEARSYRESKAIRDAKQQKTEREFYYSPFLENRVDKETENEVEDGISAFGSLPDCFYRSTSKE